MKQPKSSGSYILCAPGGNAYRPSWSLTAYFLVLRDGLQPLSRITIITMIILLRSLHHVGSGVYPKHASAEGA